jgi:hypothetical protein
VATPETEERLLSVGRGGTAHHVERIVRAWRAVDRTAQLRETAERHRARALHVYQDEDGMVVIRGRLEPEAGAVLLQALAAARETIYRRDDVPAGTWNGVPDDSPTFGQQQVDALALLAETALHHGMEPGTPGERYQVVVHVDAAVLADANALGQSVVEGARISGETAQRLACDASRVVMQHDADGQITEVGARTRIAAVDSPAVARDSVRATTSATGRTAARQPCRISPCSVAGIIASSTRRDFR